VIDVIIVIAASVKVVIVVRKWAMKAMPIRIIIKAVAIEAMIAIGTAPAERKGKAVMVSRAHT
jgi:hypothetical protein